MARVWQQYVCKDDINTAFNLRLMKEGVEKLDKEETINSVNVGKYNASFVQRLKLDEWNTAYELVSFPGGTRILLAYALIHTPG